MKKTPSAFQASPPSMGGRAGAVLTVVTDCPPETGATSEAEGVDSFPFTFDFSPFGRRPSVPFSVHYAEGVDS